MSYAASHNKRRALGTAAWITAAEQAATHDAALLEYKDLNTAVTNLSSVWAALPVAPYPPASDQTAAFPETGTMALVLKPTTVTAVQLAEPAKAAAGLAAQAAARIPAVTPLFWIGLACLVGGIYVMKR